MADPTTPPSTLPVHLTSFVGRRRRSDLAAVSALLGGRRLVTRTGDRWLDGVWWVELEVVHGTDGPRYRLLESVAAYCVERCTNRLRHGSNMLVISAQGRRQGGLTAGLGLAAGPAWPMGTT